MNRLLGKHLGKMLKLCSWAAMLVVLFCSLQWQATDPGLVRAQERDWSLPINLSNTMTKSWLPSACADRAGNVHVVWAEFVDPQSSTSDTLYYTMWDGKNWTKPADIAITGHGPASQARNAVWYPACAADSHGQLHVVWTDTHSIYYSRAPIGKDTWKAVVWSVPRPIFLNPNAPGGFPDIAVDSQDTIHIMFNTYDESFHIRSIDGGETWSEPVPVAVTPDRATRPRLFVDDQDILHVGITEVNETDNGIGVLYTRSLDGGQTWEDAQRLDAETGAEYPILPTINMDGQGTLHAVWVAWRDRAFYHQTSEDRGISWSRPERIVGATGQAGFRAPSMAMDSAGVLHLLLSYKQDVFHLRWTGSGWTQPVNVSQSESSSNMPTLLVTEGNQLHAVWLEFVAGQDHVHDEGNMEIWYSRLQTDAPHLPPQPLPTQPPATPTSAPTSQPKATLQPTSTPPRVYSGSDDVPRSSLDTTSALMIGLGITVTVMGLVTAGWLWLGGRGGS